MLDKVSYVQLTKSKHATDGKYTEAIAWFDIKVKGRQFDHGGQNQAAKSRRHSTSSSKLSARGDLQQDDIDSISKVALMLTVHYLFTQ